MSEEFLITEELILEFLDPLTAKSYVWTVEDTLPPQTRFQASFVDDKGKKYFISFKRDGNLGKNSRQVMLSVQKNKNTSFKVNIDRGSFLKILGTLVQVYAHYKNENSDGKMTGSYAFVFPDSFAKYMKFVARVTKRLFKTEPKLRLELVGAEESVDTKTILYYTNPASVYPYFGGKYFEGKNIKGDFYETLGGKDVQSDLPVQNKGVLAQDEDVIDQSKNNLGSILPKGVEEPLFHPANSNFGGDKSSVIQMKVDSGSSSLKAGDKAQIVGLYANSKAKEVLPQYNIPLTDFSKFNGKGIMIVKVYGKDKYVALPVHASGNNDPKNSFDYLDSNSNKIPEPEVPKPVVTPETPNAIPDSTAAKNPNAKELFVDIKDIARQSFEKVDVGPITMNLSGASVLEITESVKKISNFFGGLEPKQARNIIRETRYHLDEAVTKYVEKVNSALRKEGAFLKFNYENESDNQKYNSIDAYTSSSYEAINAYLRKGIDGIAKQSETYQKQTIAHIKNIDETFAEYGVRLPSDLVTYRGASISGNDIAALNSDQSIPLTGYASVSLKPSIAESFANVNGANLVDAGEVLFKSYKEEQKELPQAKLNTRQGNKILYNIDRLDRCLSLMIKDISSHGPEEEILLNRGTRIRRNMLIKVLDRDKSDQQVTDNDGVWFCKASIAHNKLAEGIKDFRSYVLKEQEEPQLTSLDTVAILGFILQDIEESLPEE